VLASHFQRRVGGGVAAEVLWFEELPVGSGKSSGDRQRRAKRCGSSPPGALPGPRLLAPRFWLLALLFPRHLDLRFDAVRRHMKGKIERVDTLPEFKRPAD
jgi:hypothetical protein